jgi:hypothetical protein
VYLTPSFYTIMCKKTKTITAMWDYKPEAVTGTAAMSMPTLGGK